MHDLYATYPDFFIDIHHEQQLLREHDVIIFQHPLYTGIERMLKNDDIMFTQQLLFMVNIDKKIRIGCVQIVHGNVFQCLSRL